MNFIQLSSFVLDYDIESNFISLISKDCINIIYGAIIFENVSSEVFMFLPT